MVFCQTQVIAEDDQAINESIKVSMHQRLTSFLDAKHLTIFDIDLIRGLDNIFKIDYNSNLWRREGRRYAEEGICAKIKR